MVDLEELATVCKVKGFNAFIVDWKDLKNVVSEKWEMDATMSALVGTMITSNNVIEKPSSIILPEKYSDF